MPEQAVPGTDRLLPPATGEQAASSRVGAALGVVVLLLGVASVLLVMLRIPVGPGGSLRDAFGGDDTAGAEVGDCVAELPRIAGTEAKAADDARVVPCTAAEAAYAVVGRVRDAAAARDRSATGCRPYFRPGDDEYVLYRLGGDGDGYLLCLVRRANRR